MTESSFQLIGVAVGEFYSSLIALKKLHPDPGSRKTQWVAADSGGVRGAVFLMFSGCFFGVVFESVLVTFLMELGSLLVPFGPTFLMFFEVRKEGAPG